MLELSQTDICNLKVMVDEEICQTFKILKKIEDSGYLFDGSEHLWHTDRLQYLEGLSLKLKYEIII